MERDFGGYTITKGGQEVRRTVWVPDDIEIGSGNWGRSACSCPCRIAHQYSYGKEETECDSSGVVVARAIMERDGSGYIPILLCGPCAVRILDPRYGVAQRNAAVWRSSVNLAPGLAGFALVAGYALSLPVPWAWGIAAGLVAAWAAARLWYAYATKGMPRD